MSGTQKVILAGCRPEPLMHYLKGLAVVRILGSQLDSSTVRASWENDQLCISSPLSEVGLVEFLLDHYRPTPVTAPWNGGSGYWDETTAGKALATMEASTGDRFAPYRKAIEAARAQIRRLGLEAAPKSKEKEIFLRALRAHLPDEALEWLDTAVVLTESGPEYAPLLGTGGNDGRLDFSANFLQRLTDVLPLQGEWAPADRKRSRKGEGPSREQSVEWLRTALFREGNPSLKRAAVGQFHPGGAGGANATAGMEGDSLVNPWEYVLMIEGALALAGSVARRMGSDGIGRASLPFTVYATSAGSSTLTAADEAKARAEIWLPLWERPASWGAVQQLISEGRAQLRGRQARTGLDFARAVAALGVDRSISQFQRYGFMERNGLAYLAVPMGRIHVRHKPAVRLIDELDIWLDGVRRQAADDAPNSLKRAVRRIEESIFAYATEGAQEGGRRRLLDVLVAVAEAELAVSRSKELQKEIRPIMGLLSAEWLAATDDQSAEYAIAASLASINHREQGPLRSHWLPLKQEKNGGLTWADPSDRDVELTHLLPAMVAMLKRRLLPKGEGNGSLSSIKPTYPVSLIHLDAFLEGRTDDRRIVELLPALALVRQPDGHRAAGEEVEIPPLLSRPYALLKPLFWPEAIFPGSLGEPNEREPRPPAGILGRLVAGDLQGALDQAARRFRAADLTPIGYRQGKMPAMKPPGGSYLRLAAALLLTPSSPKPLFALVLPSTDD